MFSKYQSAAIKAANNAARVVQPGTLPSGKEPILTPEFLTRAKETGASADAFLRHFNDGVFSPAVTAAKSKAKTVHKAEKKRPEKREKTGERSLLMRVLAPAAMFVIGAILIATFQSTGYLNRIIVAQLTGAVGASAIAFLLGFLPVLAFTRFTLWAISAFALIVFGLLTTPGIGAAVIAPLAVGAFVGGITLAVYLFVHAPDTSTQAYGSARKATRADVDEAGLFKAGGYRLGVFEDGKGADLLAYAGQKHLLTCAPTRAGKGTTAIIPNLLTYDGSVMVIDPKGENLLITAQARHGLGHDVHALDPWNIAVGRFGSVSSRFNPLDFLAPDDPDLVENAMILADALIISAEGEGRFWDEEAKAMLMGIILYVATAEEETAQRHLPRVRELISLDDEEVCDLFERMMISDHPAVRSAGARALQKTEKMRSMVLASAQAQTHFLDSERIRENMSASDFSFADLKAHRLSIYVILPADRLSTFGRWLRLVVSIAITENARNIDVKPKKPVLFLLDELAALGPLKAVEAAYGLMAGFGMQFWGIVQDLSQLKRIYGESWETFIGNSGVLQYFGSRDKMTAEYFSALCGQETTQTVSGKVQEALFGGFTKEPGAYGEVARPLFMADELMVMKRDQQLLLVESNYPILAKRAPWFEDPALRQLGHNLEA